MSAKIVNERQTFKTGDVIFEEGDAGECAYILDSGSIELSKTHNGRVLVTEIVRQGMFGILPLIDSKPRQFAAIARSNVTVTLVSKHAFAKRMESSDPVVQAVMRLLTKSFRESTDRLSQGGILNEDNGDFII